MTRVALEDGVGYEVRDDGEGLPILFLHGFAGTGETWGPILPVLGSGRRTIVVDLLGHGRSDAPVDPARHAVERQAADLAAILGHLDARPADVLGYSFGARIALRLALDHPDAVHRLVLESPSAGIADPAERAARRAADERWVELLERGHLAAFADAWEDQPLFASRHRLPRDVRAAVRAQQLASPARGLAASLQGAGQGAMEPLHDRLADVAAPALVLAGALDRTGRERAAAVASAMTDARLEVLDGAGHAPHLEAADEFVRLVLAFLPSPAVVQ